MINLEEKVVNCFSSFIKALNCGKTDRDYCLLYDAILLLKNNITEDKYVQYFNNNLTCPIIIDLVKTDEMDRIIGFTLNSSDTVLETFTWTETESTNLKTYNITTNSVSGYNFLYFSTPPGTNVRIYDALNNLLFDSSTPGNYEFELAGSVETSKGQTNVVYKKKNVYNSINPVTFTVSLF